MVVLRLPTSLLWLLVIVIIALIAIFAFIKLNKAHPTVNVNLIPYPIQYALEYFNAAYSNATIIVPSQYYSAAKSLSINGNRAVENTTLYHSILFGSAKLPAGYNILIDLENVSSLPSLTFFPYNFTTETLSNSLRDCEVAKDKTEAFAVCSIYSNVTIPISNSTSISKSVRIGFGTFVAFPNSTYLYEVNGTLSYNGQNTTYIPSIKINNTRFYNGLMFLYQNTTAFFLSKADLNTFYGREMFLPNSTLKNVVANFLSARIIS